MPDHDPDPNDSPLGQTVHLHARDAEPGARSLKAPARFLVPADAPELAVRVGDEPITLGRGAQNGLRLDDPTVSGRHCVLQQRLGLLWVEDLGSTNGTFVNGKRVEQRVVVPVGAVVHVGKVAIRHELRDEQAIAEEGELSGELKAAARYITDLLPEPWIDRAVEVAWKLAPCRRLGGDSLGYLELEGSRVAIYLIDVCGHGVCAALHSVSVLNALRQRSLPADAADPGAVLTQLGRAFPMEAHGGMFFTIWYGVVDVATRRLRYSSAGHPPALLVPAGASEVRRLSLRRPPIGTADGIEYGSDEVTLPPDSYLYVYSDGIIEEPGRDGRQLGLRWLEGIVRERQQELPREPERIEQALRQATGAQRLQDDFTLLVSRLR